MGTEHVTDVAVRRHVLTTDRAFAEVMDGIYAGISQPVIDHVFRDLAAAASWADFTAIVQGAQGSAGLMRFLSLELDNALTLDPQSGDQAGHQLVRLIAGNPVTMGQMTRHVSDAGSYAPVTILIESLPDGGTRMAYDSVASAIAGYQRPGVRRREAA
ncbi:MAG TPA: hypothetical protein VEL03_09715 [Streptosporangiaceae bacterium]|nr:hypothetical protein [Streptosporangiaceae bacterium]